MHAVVQSPLHERLILQTLNEIFGEIDPETFAKIRPCMTPMHLHGGTVLMRQGDLSDSIYLVLSGRLRATLLDADQRTVELGEIGRGEPIGEMGVITGATRGATVTAMRDCVLLRLSANDFTNLLNTWPLVALPLARKLIHRLSRTNLMRPKQHHVINICVLPLHTDLDARALSERLRTNLQAQLMRSITAPAGGNTAQDYFPIAMVDPSVLTAVLGVGADDLGSLTEQQHHEFLAWLDEQETQHSMQIFVADHADTEWTRLCLRHADHVLLAADADGDADMTAAERASLAGEHPAIRAMQSIWLLHPDERRNPSNTQRWLAARPHIAMEGMSHFHTRQNYAPDWSRLARILTGQAVGLVLAGGGARGFAHLGVMQVLEENKIEWDMAGGTSIGSVMGAFAAMDLPAQTVTALVGTGFSKNPTGDVNYLPFMSLIRGKRFASIAKTSIEAAVGASIDVEDLWKPFFCIAANYSRAVVQVMRAGPLIQAVMASASIPAALPPVLWRGDLLMDGGTFNNYPVDVMRASGANRVIGVSLGVNDYRPLALEEMPQSYSIFFDRFFRARKNRRYRGLPSIPTIIFNVAVLSSRTHQDAMQEQVDVGFTPNVSRVGMMQWTAFKRVVDIGLNHARTKLAESTQLFTPDWFSSQHKPVVVALDEMAAVAELAELAAVVGDVAEAVSVD